jgi:hypothetical protein
VPDEISAARAKSVCKGAIQSKQADNRHHAEQAEFKNPEQAEFKNLVIVEEPVAHAAEDGRARI